MQMDDDDKLVFPSASEREPVVNRPPLSEKDFIQEGYSKNPFPLWIWLALLATLAALLWGGSNWFRQGMENSIDRNPFLQVTNREMSLFLWQFPEFMRGNIPIKEGYLPGINFKGGKMSVVAGEADKFVSAPPEVLFLYHTWSRLLKPESSGRMVSLDAFKEFLGASPEWMPDNWPSAPKGYVSFVSGIDSVSEGDFVREWGNLPRDVQIAAVGWLNFNKDGDAIDKVSPSFGEMENFLNSHPNYARNFWRNILLESRPDYLKTNFGGKFDAGAKVPSNEMAGFLQFAYFNFIKGSMQSKNGASSKK